MTLERQLDSQQQPSKLIFVFTCRTDPTHHSTQRRARTETSHGTKNLQRTLAECNRRRGVDTDSSTNAQQTLHGSISRYTPARHRAVIALRCASSHRPFESYADPFYLQEVELLRPGTKVPTPSTISRDVKTIYAQASKHVKDYFKV